MTTTSKRTTRLRRKKVVLPKTVAHLTRQESAEVWKFCDFWQEVFDFRLKLRRGAERWEEIEPEIAEDYLDRIAMLDRAILKIARNRRGTDAIKAIVIVSRVVQIGRHWDVVEKALTQALAVWTQGRNVREYVELEMKDPGLRNISTPLGMNDEHAIHEVIDLLCDPKVLSTAKLRGPRAGVAAVFASLYRISERQVFRDLAAARKRDRTERIVVRAVVAEVLPVSDED